MKKTIHICRFIATLGPIGYLNAPGTMATLVTVPFAYGLQVAFPTQLGYLKVLGIVMIVGFIIIDTVLKHFKHYDGDPAEIVFDEVIGCLITFWGVPLSAPVAVIGFVLFRFFDIFKIGGIKYFERLVGAWGIILDDITAALIANIILRIVFFNFV